MADTTPNIGLKKPLENEFADIGIINGNMDKIDQSLGAMTTVPTAAKDAAGAIAELHENLQPKPRVPIVLKNGVQIVQGGDVPAILHPEMAGRTLINRLGRDGNCEDASKWTAFANGAIALNSANYVYGSNSIKLTQTNTSGTAAAGSTLSSVIKPNSYYVLAAEVKNIDASVGVFIRFRSFNGSVSTYFQGNQVTNTGSFTPSFIRFQVPSDMVSCNVEFASSGTVAGQGGYFDGIRLFEISLAEYNAIASMTATQIAGKYPYVDDMKHVNAVYIENKGGNLLPTTAEIAQPNLNGAIPEIFGAYKVKLTTINTGQFVGFLNIPVIPGQTYTMSATLVSGNGKMYVNQIDKNGVQIIQNVSNSIAIPLTFTPEANTVLVNVFFGDSGAISSFTIENYMIIPGSVVPPFEPQQQSYMYLPDCNLRSNVDGSITDRLYTDGQGKPRVTRRFREMVLDGSFAWQFSNDSTGFKTVFSVCAPNPVASSGKVIKYDGKILKDNDNSVADGQRLFVAGDLYISVSDTDSGWGESYTQLTVDEIKAYFWGWEMGVWDSGTSTFTKGYNGTGTKAWRPIGDTHVSNNVVGSIVPTQMATGFNYKPYRLMYQLAQSVDEAINYEGSLMLHEDVSQVEVGTGIVVREAANVKDDASNAFINNAYSGVVSASVLKNRAKLLLSVYKNGIKDNLWILRTGIPTANGGADAITSLTNMDKTAAYSVTYLALDTYTIGIAPQTINAEYAPNIRESVDSLVREVVEARTEISVLRNTKAQKQQPQWITPTLLNGWVNYNDSGWYGALYYKNEIGEVIIEGMIKDGSAATGTVLFYLPIGHRPSKSLVRSTISNATGYAVGGIRIYPDGRVTIETSAGNTFFALSARFRAEL